MFNKYLKLKPTKIGMRVFTDIQIPAKSPVLQFKGTIFTKEKLQHEMGQVLQIGPNIYLGPSGGIDDYINHSCDPNCALHIVGTRAILYSLYVIQADTQLTFDYSSSSTDLESEWKMDCQCDSPKCRKVISGFHNLSDLAKEEMNNKQMLPLFMKHSLFMKK
jgi:hypothetical protein